MLKGEIDPTAKSPETREDLKLIKQQMSPNPTHLLSK